MKTLWAPWRMAYIEEPPPSGCFFCAALASDDDRAHLVLARDPEAIVLLNKFPYGSGHLLVAPRAHIGCPEELPDPAHIALANMVRDAYLPLRRHATAFAAGAQRAERALRRGTRAPAPVVLDSYARCRAGGRHARQCGAQSEL